MNFSLLKDVTRENAANDRELMQGLSPASIRVCALDELPLGLGRAFDIGGRIIAFFRTRGGKIFAIDNRCPHKGGPLSEGMLAADAIVCPLHSFRFEMPAGSCDQPGTCSVTTYPVVLQDDAVYITLPLQS